MHADPENDTAQAAFARLGQTKEAGCLSIILEDETALIFVRNGMVVNIYTGGVEGDLAALDMVWQHPETSHLWIPDTKPPRESMGIAIDAYIAKKPSSPDIHKAKTAKMLGSPSLHEVKGEIAKKRGSKFSLVSEELPGRKYRITASTMVIGRDKSCDIVIANRKISRRHCLLQLIVRGLSFRDLESTNGVFVNGVPLEGGLLQPGDRLSLGKFTLIVQREE